MHKSRVILPFINTSISRDFFWVIVLIPLWWALGIGFCVFHFISLLIVIKLVLTKARHSEKIRLPKELILLLFFIFAYVFSIILNWREIPFPRLLGTFYNLSFWFMGFFVILAIYNAFEKQDVYNILRAFYSLGIFVGIFAVFVATILFLSMYFYSLFSL